ncbi:hypothetical protein PTTG_29175 [Puccinia triticina 1-1 BBBD Race 1]|uniref:Uncharacterized protein n=1 Tax=Puccinia triticina (isolate 1-1 / race 1 (BBBD)) TaxID=630390 RepID=A0A180G5X7_PUCT1|nr:hypothetical protein PTTG_29175 [Puccinia triticina 1-1 BBBD Race 1]
MEEVPSTPPNTTDHSHTVPESVTRRESSRIRTPMSRPGFIATQSDSRRALVPILPKPKQSRSTNHQVDVEEEHLELGSGGTSQLDSQAPTQVSSRTGQQVTVNLRQDSNDENRVANVRKADQSKDKDGFDHVSLYFWPLCEGPKQDLSSKGNRCRWCPNEFKAQARSSYNLKCHRDGTYIKGSLRPPCPGRANAIAAGAHLPSSAAQAVIDKAEAQPAGVGNLIAYTTKGQFNNDTLNRLLVIWIVRQSLPWIRIEDYLLRVCFDYAMHNTKLHSRVWAASVAHKL